MKDNDNMIKVSISLDQFEKEKLRSKNDGFTKGYWSAMNLIAELINNPNMEIDMDGIHPINLDTFNKIITKVKTNV